LHGPIDLRGHLAANYCPYETHQPLRLAQFIPPDRLHHDQKSVVHSIIQILRTQLPAQIVTDTPREHPIQLLHSAFIAAPDIFNQG
jgi:hypothetical protein